MKRIFFLGLLMAPMLAVAASNQSLDLGKVVEQQQQIRKDLNASSGKYRGMSSTQQAELVRRQDNLFQMFEGKQTSADLTTGEQMEAFNDLEWIEAALNKAEANEQMVCTRERTVGSNRVKRVCRTRQQMEFEREQARNSMDEAQQGLER